MIGLAVGSFEASRTEPRLCGVSRQGDTHTPWPCGSLMPSSTMCTGAKWNWMSGAGAPVSDAGEAAGLGEVGGERPGLRRFELLQRRRLEREQQALRLGRRPHQLRGGVVGQVLADRGLVEQHLDFAHRQVFGRPDPRQHQQLRRVVGAAAQDHLALGAQLLQPRRAGSPARRPRACPRTAPAGRACRASR